MIRAPSLLMDGDVVDDDDDLDEINMGNRVPALDNLSPQLAAYTLHKLDDLLMSLRENKPELTSVDTSHLLCNYSPAIGPCLRNNTHVTSLTLAVPMLFAYGIHFTLLKFVRTSNNLRKISLVSGGYSFELAQPPFDHLYIIFCEEATAFFVEYMQSRREDSSLRSLDLVWAFVDDDNDSNDYDYKKEFERLCGSLRKNDPNINQIDPLHVGADCRVPDCSPWRIEPR
jgi:hypothetical protein